MGVSVMRIGVDIGGTKVLGGLIDAGRVVDAFRLKTKGYTSTASLVQAIAQEIRTMLEQNRLSMQDIEHIGFGIPGTVDWVKGDVLYSPNLFGTQQIHLADMLEEELHVRPTLVQDSWAGAYAEYLVGQQKKYSSMLCVTLGTGIGCGIILDGHVYAGTMGTAGEIGHVSIQKGGRLCSCGRRGCLETYASGTAIFNQAKKHFPQKLPDDACGAEAVFKLADQGDEDALALIREAVDSLAFGLATLIDITACPVLFISGGLSAHEELMIAPLAKAMQQYGYPAWSCRQLPLVQRAALGEDAPMIGAALLDCDDIRRG